MLFPWIQSFLIWSATFPKLEFSDGSSSKSAMARWKSPVWDFRRWCQLTLCQRVADCSPRGGHNTCTLKHCLQQPQNKMFHVWGMVVRQSYSRRHMIECPLRADQPCNVTFEFVPSNSFTLGNSGPSPTTWIGTEKLFTASRNRGTLMRHHLPTKTIFDVP